MGCKLLDLPDSAKKARNTFGHFEDFQEFTSGDLFTDTSADSGAAVANVDAAGGQVTLTTGGTDNNECYLLGTKELFLFAADKPLRFDARVKFTEANTDDANVAIGLMDAVGADSILDNGGGPKASFSGAVFYKIDGETNWNVRTSIGTTKTTTALTAAYSLDKLLKSSGGGTWQEFRIEFLPISSTEGEVTYYIDGILVAKHVFTFTSATEMKDFVGNKAGDTNSEVCYVDYISCFQTR